MEQQLRPPPSIDIISGGRQGLALSITIHGMWVEDTIVEGINYQILSIPACAQISYPGKPMLPFVSKLIAIAPQMEVHLSTDDLDSVILDNYYVHPAQYPQIDSGGQNSFVIDTFIYGQNAFYPEPVAKCGAPAIFRDLRVTDLNFFPISFNPQAQKLKVLTGARVEVDFIGSDTLNILSSWPTSVAPLFDALYKNTILNYNTLGIPTETLTKNRYLIISDVSFVDALNPFIVWKKKKGLEVFLEVIETDLQRKPIYIKNLITNYFVTPARRIGYVLLVGEALEVADSNVSVAPPLIPIYNAWPHYSELGGGYTWSDYWYTTIVGDDDIADVALGRFSFLTASECTTVVNKTFAFERYPDTAHWCITKHDLVSYRRTLKQDSAYHECKMDSIADPILTPYGFQYYDDWGEDSTDESVISHINNSGTKKGISLLNYRGHGNVQSWSTWYTGAPPGGAFTNTTICSLTNFIDSRTAWLPIVFEIACWCGRAGSDIFTTCHSECWVSCSTGGGVAALGAANKSATDSNHKLDTELYRISFGDEVRPAVTQELGWVINNAKIKMRDAYGWADSSAMANMRIYHLMGDPEINIYTGWNGYILANHAHSTSDEYQNFVVTVYDENSVPLPGALVCLYQHSGLHTIQLTNNDGIASFWITPCSGWLYITVTKHDHGPYEGMCRVIPIGAGGPQAYNESFLFSFNYALYDHRTRAINISYQLPKNSFVEIKIYDVAGRLVDIIEKGLGGEGVNQSKWTCHDKSGRTLSNGIYFIKLTAGESEAIKKVIVY